MQPLAVLDTSQWKRRHHVGSTVFRCHALLSGIVWEAVAAEEGQFDFQIEVGDRSVSAVAAVYEVFVCYHCNFDFLDDIDSPAQLGSQLCTQKRRAQVEKALGIAVVDDT